jgi:hypothetical protein
MGVEPRELRQLVDRYIRANKDQEFTDRQLANAIGAPDVAALRAALDAVIKCPFPSCQSLDTMLASMVDEEYEVHRCNSCNRNFHVEREEHGRSIVGLYLE